MYASTLPRLHWLRRASIRLAWYGHTPASSFLLKSKMVFQLLNKLNLHMIDAHKANKIPTHILRLRKLRAAEAIMFLLCPVGPMSRVNIGIFFVSHKYWTDLVITTTNRWTDYILVQRGAAWAGCGSAQSPPGWTKCNSPPINGQCTNFVSFDVAL